MAKTVAIWRALILSHLVGAWLAGTEWFLAGYFLFRFERFGAIRWPVEIACSPIWVVPTLIAAPVSSLLRRHLFIGPPYIAFAVTYAAAVTLTFNQIRRRGVEGGNCATCGYDLRASKERCPECGTPIPLRQGSARVSNIRHPLKS